MFRNHVHSVNERIVSLSQPKVRSNLCRKLTPQLQTVLWTWSASRLITSTKAPTLSKCGIITMMNMAFIQMKFWRTRCIAPARTSHCAVNLGIRLSGPRLGRKPKHVDPKRRHDDQKAENRRGEIERKFAFIKGKLSLDLATNRTAETIAVRIDSAVFMANLERLFSTFAGQISLTTALGGVHRRINYQSTLMKQNIER